jgi:uncharacterized protein YdaT
MNSNAHELHIVPEGNAWKIDKTHTNEAPSRFDTKKEAIEEAKSIAMDKGHTEVVIHGSDGKIIETTSY